MGKNVLRSEICEMLGIEYPIFLAGMGSIPGMPRTGKYYTGTSVELVAAVSNAGGFGVFGAAGLSPEQIPEAVKDIKALTDKPFGIDLLLPVSVDRTTQAAVNKMKENLPKENKEYFAWMEEVKKKYGLPGNLVMPEHTEGGLEPDYINAQFEAAVSVDGPVALCSGVGNSQDAVDRIHKEGKLSISLVGNVRQAKRVAEFGADIIVAQGTEAGGHTGKIGTLALVPQVVDAVAPIPVLAAGGIGDSRGVAASFTLGAKGVWIGTAFLASKETSITDVTRQKIIDATEDGTVITEMFTGKTARVIKHPVAKEWTESGFKTLGMPLQIFSIRELCEGMEQSGKPDLFMLPAGQVSGMIDRVRPAKEILDEMVSGTVDKLKGGQLSGVTIKQD
ncbi:MAG: nitronate monooxygenase family protein [Thermodesulfobacteriota bacterium]|nr:nitronate monooxygenase family protein [Thermodesulfobacteriota bacterium]